MGGYIAAAWVGRKEKRPKGARGRQRIGHRQVERCETDGSANRVQLQGPSRAIGRSPFGGGRVVLLPIKLAWWWLKAAGLGLRSRP